MMNAEMQIGGPCALCGQPQVAHGDGKCPDSKEIGIARAAAALIKPKASYVGAPAIFRLEQACKHINDAFWQFGCYVVGSATQRPDWRDVDVRFIMEDAQFAQLFPNAGDHWEFDARWLLLTVSITAWLREQTGLPIDFQIQPQTHANERHKGPRHPVGLTFKSSSSSAATGKAEGK